MIYRVPVAWLTGFAGIEYQMQSLIVCGIMGNSHIIDFRDRSVQ
jgi:hypothetical protein